MSEHSIVRFKGGVLTDEVRMSPVDRYQLAFRRIVIGVLATIGTVVLVVIFRSSGS
jgi:hypothetical protein